MVLENGLKTVRDTVFTQHSTAQHRHDGLTLARSGGGGGVDATPPHEFF